MCVNERTVLNKEAGSMDTHMREQQLIKNSCFRGTISGLDACASLVMVKLKKPSNVLNILYRLEYGLAKDTYRHATEAMRQLISDESSPFTLIERFKTSNPVLYDERKLYLDNYKNVKLLYGGGPTDKPIDLYKLSGDFSPIRDALVITYSQVPVCPVPREVYRPSFFALTYANHLIRLDSETGQILDDIYLGSTYIFTTLNWENHAKRLVLQTNNHRKNRKRDAAILQAVCLMEIFPLQFVALFELESAVVGENVRTANVSEGLLILGPQLHVCIYDLSELINDENRICHCRLYETNDMCSHGPIGTFPTGLPVNYSVKSLPPPLLDVQCVGQSVQFGATPFHYIYQPTRHHDEIYIADLRDERVIAKLPSESILPDSTQCFFHWDDTGRIVHQKDNAIDVYKLVNDEQLLTTDGKKLELQFTLKCEPSTKKSPKLTARQKAIAKSRLDVEDQSEIFKLDYENETEFLIILGVGDSNDCIGCIRIFDNWTGELIRHIDLDITLNDWAEYILIMDIDVIVLVETVDRDNTVFIYKLDRSSTG